MQTQDIREKTEAIQRVRIKERTGGLGADTTGGADLDVQGSDANLLEAVGDVLGRQHGCVRRGLHAHAGMSVEVGDVR